MTSSSVASAPPDQLVSIESEEPVPLKKGKKKGKKAKKGTKKKRMS